MAQKEKIEQGYKYTLSSNEIKLLIEAEALEPDDIVLEDNTHEVLSFQDIDAFFTAFGITILSSYD